MGYPDHHSRLQLPAVQGICLLACFCYIYPHQLNKPSMAEQRTLFRGWSWCLTGLFWWPSHHPKDHYPFQWWYNINPSTYHSNNVCSSSHYNMCYICDRLVKQRMVFLQFLRLLLRQCMRKRVQCIYACSSLPLNSSFIIERNLPPHKITDYCTSDNTICSHSQHSFCIFCNRMFKRLK